MIRGSKITQIILKSSPKISDQLFANTLFFNYKQKIPQKKVLSWRGVSMPMFHPYWASLTFKGFHQFSSNEKSSISNNAPKKTKN